MKYNMLKIYEQRLSLRINYEDINLANMTQNDATPSHLAPAPITLFTNRSLGLQI